MENSPNLAPVQELEQNKKQKPSVRKDPVEFFSALRQEMRREGESEEWVSRILASQKNEFYYKGYQKLRKADLSNSWVPISPKPIHFTFNEFQFWVNVNVAKWTASQVDYRFSGLGDTPDQEMASAKLRNIASHYDDKYWKFSQVIDASKAAQFSAYLVGYVFYDPEAEAGKAYRPVTDRRPVKLGNDAYRCVDCGYAGEFESGAPPACQHCGSPNLDIIEVPEVEMEVETGQEEYKAGDVCCDLISLYNIRWNAKLGLEKSPVILWEEEHDKDDLEATYDGIEIPQAKTDDVGLRAKAQLEHINEKESSQQSKVTLSRMWVEPRRYKRIELEKPITTYAGVEFPEGTKLIEMFPDGCHVIMIGNLIVDLYSAIKNDDLVAMPYHSMPSGGLAQGCDAMCEPQRNTNTGFSLWNLWLRHHASPNKRYIPEIIDAGDMSGDGLKPLPMNSANFWPERGMTAETAIITDQPVSLPPGVFAGLQEMRNFIQFAANVTEFSDGLPGVKNDTYGGARITQSLGQSISSTPLAQFADFRVGIIRRALKKFRQNCWDKRYIEYAGTYGQIEGEYLSSVDIPNTFEVDAIPNSHIPRTPEQKQTNLAGFLQAVGGIAGMMSLPPKLLSEYSEIFDIKFSDDIFPIAVRTARWRIKQMAALLPEMQMLQQAMEGMVEDQPMPGGIEPVGDDSMMAQGEPMPDEGMPQAPPAAPMQPISVGMQLFAALQPPFNPREQGMMETADYLSTWFTTDEGLNAPKELIEAVGVYQDACLQAQSLRQMALGAVSMAGQPMPVEGGKNGQPPGPQPQAQGAAGGG